MLEYESWEPALKRTVFDQPSANQSLTKALKCPTYISKELSMSPTRYHSIKHLIRQINHAIANVSLKISRHNISQNLELPKSVLKRTLKQLRCDPCLSV